jgi:putative ABC transport system permease protein
VRALDRKVLRELGRLRSQLLAIGMVMVCGLAVFVAMLSVYAGLGTSQREYYEDRRFADVFAHVSRAPRSLEDRIEQIPGVSQVESRIVKEVTIEVDDFPDPIVGRLNSLREETGRGLNEVHLQAGRMPISGRPQEVVVTSSFADAHGLVVGDEVRALINGRHQVLQLVGIGISPEFVYELSTTTLFPDPERYGVFWMSRSALAAAFDMESAFNEVSLELTPRADEREVRARLDMLLDPYGGRDSHGRDLQTSHRYLEMEIEQLQSSGVIVPMIFLGVAAFLLNVVFSRIISTQREQIAALKAVGYSNREIGFHYSKFVFIIVLLGSLVGSVVGVFLGRGLANMYAPFFKFPEVHSGLDPRTLIYGVLITSVAAALGTFRAVRSAIRLPPAEAMRPRPPSPHGRLFLERVGINALLSTMGRMTMRNLAERPVRAALTSLGIAFSVAILVVGNFAQDSLEYLTYVQFSKTQRDDIMVVFNTSQRGDAEQELAHLPGVLYVEPFRSVPATLVHGTHRKQISIQGIPRGADLRHVLDEDLVAHELPEEGLLLTDQLARILDVRVGDSVRMEVLEGRRPEKEVVVAGTVGELMGLNAYMDMGALNRTMGEGDRISGGFLLVDDRESDALFRELVDLPGVAAVVRKTAALESFESSSADMQLTMRLILVFFASVISVGVVYNSARITLSERSRELASLRVLGFSKAEVSWILLYEFGVLLVAALPIGCLLGYFLATAAMINVDAELYRFPLIISSATYAFASIVVLITGLATALLVRRRINELDLVAVLKNRE